MSITADRFRYDGWTYVSDCDTTTTLATGLYTVLPIFRWNDMDETAKAIKPIVDNFVRVKDTATDKRLYSLYYQTDSNRTWFYIIAISGSFRDLDNKKRHIHGALRYQSDVNSQQTYFIIANQGINERPLDWFIATNDSVEIYNKNVTVTDSTLFFIDDKVPDCFWGYVENDSVLPIQFGFNGRMFIFFDTQAQKCILYDDYTSIFRDWGIRLRSNSALVVDSTYLKSNYYDSQ